MLPKSDIVRNLFTAACCGPLTPVQPGGGSWHFGAGVRERFDATHADFHADLDVRLRALIDVLGPRGRERPAHDSYDHVVVLGGGIRVALGRIPYAGRLLAGGLRNAPTWSSELQSHKRSVTNVGIHGASATPHLETHRSTR